jgi:uncharacterized protein DUF4136
MRHLIGVMFTLIACGCSTMQVKSYSSAQSNFSGLKTYSWAPGPQQLSGNPRIDGNPELDKLVREDIDAELAHRGYVRAADGTPDFLVGYHATLNKRVSVETLDESSGYEPNYSFDYGLRVTPEEDRQAVGRKYVDTFNEGTLIIDVVNPKTKQLMWRGTAIDEVNFKNNPERRQAKIKEAVKKILDQFPQK